MGTHLPCHHAPSSGPPASIPIKIIPVGAIVGIPYVSAISFLRHILRRSLPVYHYHLVGCITITYITNKYICKFVRKISCKKAVKITKKSTVLTWHTAGTSALSKVPRFVCTSTIESGRLPPHRDPRRLTLITTRVTNIQFSPFIVTLVPSVNTTPHPLCI